MLTSSFLKLEIDLNTSNLRINIGPWDSCQLYINTYTYVFLAVSMYVVQKSYRATDLKIRSLKIRGLDPRFNFSALKSNAEEEWAEKGSE